MMDLKQPARRLTLILMVTVSVVLPLSSAPADALEGPPPLIDALCRDLLETARIPGFSYAI